jgi:cytoskeleton protein RodZ
MTEGLGSAGALLRAAREKQGLHIAALAAAIKVSPRKLDALENDRWDELPDATFTRALAQTVCRTLKIDSRPVLELLPAAHTAGLEATGGGLNAPFHDRPGRDEPGLAVAAIRPMVWAAAFLLVAAVAMYFLPEGVLTMKPAAEPASASASASAPVLVVPPTVLMAASAASAASSAATAASAPEAPASEPVAAVAMAASAAPAPAPGVIALPPAAPVTAPAVAATAVPPPARAASAPAGALQLRTSAASWIEVRDGRGQLLLSRIVQPGESVGLDGSPPLRLIIGNAGATQLGFRGQPVDLSSRTRDNVARVELP